MNPDDKRETLRAILEGNAPLLVAYSGGVDSAFLLAEAHRLLGQRVLGAIADSPSLPRASLAAALDLASELGARVEILRTGELDNPDYANNPPNRCYFCKAELFARMERLAAQRGFAALAYGENADDIQDTRPGTKAAAEFRVLAPLKEAGLTKAEIRAFSREMGLPTAGAPAQPCLSSRIPHGTPVTAQALAMVERAETFVRGLGFRVFRVRHLGFAAKLQVAEDELPAVGALEERLRRGLEECGYGTVYFEAYRRGG